MSAGLDAVRSRYLRFAENEAAGVSALYEELARAVAASDELLAFVAALPEAKQQPNLVFAAVRHVCGTPADADDLARMVAARGEEIRAVALSRGTQTNEPGRCATLLPVLARLPQPLALLEVGASAGLCLLPDFYAYDYGGAVLTPESVENAARAPVFPCRASAETPLPTRMPRIAWRAGLDLNPLDVGDPDAVAWLETLVWPGQEERAGRLRATIEVARRQRPRVVAGDLAADLPALAAEAPRDAPLVIFHSAVLAYVPPEVRERFVTRVRELGAVWVSNEAPAVLPAIAARLASPPPAGRFLLSVDGEPVAFTGPHGQSIDWIAG